jgi:hypothetical protein
MRSLRRPTGSGEPEPGQDTDCSIPRPPRLPRPSFDHDTGIGREDVAMADRASTSMKRVGGYGRLALAHWVVQGGCLPL